MWDIILQIIDLVQQLFNPDQLNKLFDKFFGPIMDIILGE